MIWATPRSGACWPRRSVANFTSWARFAPVKRCESQQILVRVEEDSRSTRIFDLSNEVESSKFDGEWLSKAACHLSLRVEFLEGFLSFKISCFEPMLSDFELGFNISAHLPSKGCTSHITSELMVKVELKHLAPGRVCGKQLQPCPAMRRASSQAGMFPDSELGPATQLRIFFPKDAPATSLLRRWSRRSGSSTSKKPLMTPSEAQPAWTSSCARLRPIASERLALPYPLEPLSAPEWIWDLWGEPFRGPSILDLVFKSFGSELSSPSEEDPTGPIPISWSYSCGAHVCAVPLLGVFDVDLFRLASCLSSFSSATSPDDVSNRFLTMVLAEAVAELWLEALYSSPPASSRMCNIPLHDSTWLFWCHHCWYATAMLSISRILVGPLHGPWAERPCVCSGPTETWHVGLRTNVLRNSHRGWESGDKNPSEPPSRS